MLLLYLPPLRGTGAEALIEIGIEAEGGLDAVRSSGGIAIATDDDGEDVSDGEPEVDPGNDEDVAAFNHGEFPILIALLFPPPPNNVRIPIELPTERDPFVELCDLDKDAFGL